MQSERRQNLERRPARPAAWGRHGSLAGHAWAAAPRSRPRRTRSALRGGCYSQFSSALVRNCPTRGPSGSPSGLCSRTACPRGPGLFPQPRGTIPTESEPWSDRGTGGRTLVHPLRVQSLRLQQSEASHAPEQRPCAAVGRRKASRPSCRRDRCGCNDTLRGLLGAVTAACRVPSRPRRSLPHDEDCGPRHPALSFKGSWSKPELPIPHLRFGSPFPELQDSPA